MAAPRPITLYIYLSLKIFSIPAVSLLPQQSLDPFEVSNYLVTQNILSHVQVFYKGLTLELVSLKI